ncbi:DUF6318 family protein [Nocardioides sp.]|uniref:DUF6318 family protein n=1 Tax=Nocardioides sp. TaxID=35761 RepID=UPI0039E5D682
MRRVASLIGAVVATGSLTLPSACSSGGSEAADPPPSTTPATTPSTSAPPPSPTPTGPTPPVMPEAAKSHDEAGAKAFVRYFWAVVDYAQSTGDTDAIGRESVQGCAGCENGISAIRRVYDKHGQILGGDGEVSELSVTWRNSPGLTVAVVTFTLTLQPQQVNYPDDSQDWQSDGGTFQRVLELLADDGAWKVAQFHEAK